MAKRAMAFWRSYQRISGRYIDGCNEDLLAAAAFKIEIVNT
jgi:hypothetical protein